MTTKAFLPITGILLASSVVFMPPAFADFVGDAKGSLSTQNYYFSRDFRDGVGQSKREEWAQGFILNLQSGYTEGTVGFGVDAMGMLGVKLDSSPDRTGTGLLPRGGDGRAEDEYSKLSLTAKARIGETELFVGGLSPSLPLLASNSSRLFPQIWTGAQLTSRDLDKFTFHLGQVGEVKQRDSTNSEDLTTMSQIGAYSGSATSDSYTYGGVDFEPMAKMQLSLHASELEDFYQRTFMGFKYAVPLSEDSAVFTELRYFTAEEAGAERIGEVDNRVISSLVGYSLGGHRISGGYQKVSGDTAYAYVGGSDTYLFSEQQVSTFALQNERAWHARYDYNFAAVGIPGLTFTLRYVKGDNVDPENIATPEAAALRAAGEEGREWERTTDITYVVQSGPLKDVSMRWRNATNRSTYARGADENRVMLSYAIKF
ncbi:OprD family porin [Stutzerimonas chloritidismutans]|uniref:OprD family porin n=1 Tax=Stutzerimonas chloritidismutans TaxID=203192 RepID=UPI003F169442